jgi:hypothetical protein
MTPLQKQIQRNAMAARNAVRSERTAERSAADPKGGGPVVGGMRKCRLCGLVRDLLPEDLALFCAVCRAGGGK